MSWLRLFAIIFVAWGVVFAALPRFANELAGIDYVVNPHAEDWTRIAGLLMFGPAFLLEAAHRSSNPELRRTIARGVLVFTLPCALLMTYWQLIPDGRWNRLDVINVVLLYVMSYALFVESELIERRLPLPRAAFREEVR
jgi:predicted secreted protein